MARPERPIDPAAGPVPTFAFELRKLRTRAGDPKYRTMTRRTGRSASTLADAAGGRKLPSWDTVEAYVRACGEDPADWRARWEEARDQSRAGAAPPALPAVPAPQDTHTPVEAVRDPPPARAAARWRPSRRIAVLTLVAVTIVGFVVAAVAALAGGSSGPDRTPLPAGGGPGAPTPAVSAARQVSITVQNKVALGPADLVEDDSPLYLSTRTEPYCARKGCKLPGTEMKSGTVLSASCQTQGAEMFNYNVDLPESAQNPHHVKSALWYVVEWPSGVKGYISEVYLEAQYRGGLGLPPCSPSI